MKKSNDVSDGVMTKLKIGILNIMHDKKDTKNRFTNVLTNTQTPVELRFFYPVSHYRNRPVPKDVSTMLEPLDLNKVKDLDGFIITGAPVEQLAFEEVDYWDELTVLMDFLDQQHIWQLYVCWGAMAAGYHFYGVHKHALPKKVFGIQAHKVVNNSPLLNGMGKTFFAPHARYAEMDRQAFLQAGVVEIARSEKGCLFLLEDRPQRRTFLFAHLEYGRNALKSEYEREWQAKVAQREHLAQPKNYYNLNGQPTFSWKHTQRNFFNNWLYQIKETRKLK